MRLRRIIPLFRFFFLIQDVIEKNSHYCAGKRSYDEHPNLSESFGGAVIDSGGYRGGDGAGGVNAGSGQVNTDEVDKGQGETDDETGFLACYGLLVGDVKNNVHEDASEDYLGDKSADDAACGAPMLQLSTSQILFSTDMVTSSLLVIFAMVAEEMPVAFRKSVLFISLSINNFQSFLYDTIILFSPKRLRVLYHFSPSNANGTFGSLSLSFRFANICFTPSGHAILGSV